MEHDRSIVISTGRSRKDIEWQPKITTISDLYDRLRTPDRGAETLQEYMALPKTQQDEKKDVGGFVAGKLAGGRRKKASVQSREIITLDLDNVPAFETQKVLDHLREIGCGFCVYSTRKHAPNKPRLRVLLPIDRPVSPDEYEAIARKVAETVGIEMCDPTTFEPHRLMYWPSACADTEYVYEFADAPMVQADTVLEGYTNWRDTTTWPTIPGEAPNVTALATKQGDPETKPGIVGAFCRAYDIPAAIQRFIPQAYTSCAEPGRYTYTGGSTTGGAVVYENGKFLYSHHATDPCSGKLVNAFDLIRLHLFDDRDTRPDGPVTSLPSYKAMVEFAKADDVTASLMAQERARDAVAELAAAGVAPPTESAPAPSEPPTGPEAEQTDEEQLAELIKKLDKHPKTGQIKGTIDNVRLILENDPHLKGKFALNEFAGRGEVKGALPWAGSNDRRMWCDTDSNGLYWFLEKVYGVTGRSSIDAALDLHASAHSFNEVKDYLTGAKWDGTERLDRLLIDYLGAEDCEYTKAVTRKAFTAAVARAMEPGCKFDNMLILCGPQGCGKSTLLDKMSRGWFNDSIRTFEGKEASELLQGVWIVEVAELDAFRRTDVARIKQFLSLRADRYRAAYGRNVSELPRRCVFFGTCNVMDFLQDTTGNRRFWPVDVKVGEQIAEPWDLDDETIEQLWAEATARYRAGEALYLTGEIEEDAQIRQEKHREADVNEGLIAEFVAREVPTDWASWPIDKRRDFWAGSITGEDVKTVPRDRVCALEIWVEALGGRKQDCAKAASHSINATLDRLPGWRRKDGTTQCGPYGPQRCFTRTKR